MLGFIVENKANFLGPLDDPAVASSFIFGCIFIFLNLRARFSFIAGDPFPPELKTFTLEDLTANSRFHRGMATYFMLILLVYFLSTRVGSKTFSAISGIEVDDNTLPLYAAFVLAGCIPNVPKISKLEEAVRGFAQRLAGVPSDHSFIYEKLRASKIGEAGKQSVNEQLSADPLLAKVIQSLDGGDRDYWEKAKFLNRRIRDVGDQEDKVDHITLRVRDKFSELMDAASLKLADAETNLVRIDKKVAELSTDSSKDRLDLESQKRDEVKKLKEVFTSLSYILSCGIVAVTSARKREVDGVLHDIGFDVDAGIKGTIFNRTLEAVVYSSVVVCLATFLATIFSMSNEALAPALPNSLSYCFVAPFQFFILNYVGIRVYLWRREQLTADGGNQTYYIDPKNNKVRMTKRLETLVLSILSIFVLVPFFDATFILSVNDAVNWSNAFAIDKEYYWISMASYPTSAVITLIVFSYLVEFDQSNDRNSQRHNFFNSPPLAAVITISTALFCATANYAVNYIVVNNNNTESVGNFLPSTLNGFLEEQSYGSLMWYFLSAFIGSLFFFTFFYILSRTKRP